jgi:putative DNA methylase
MTTEHPIISPKKLIEVALPLDAINAACAREKSIRHGHPSTLHLWWARRPLAAARAVIFSQLVHDPEDLWWHQNPGAVPNSQVRGHWTKARQKLFEIIEEIVLWENTTNEVVLNRARAAIRESWRQTCELNKSHPQAAELFNPDRMPGLHDPFAGGGAIPLEAQRLGLEAYASDLNPVAVLINKAMIEIPPKFAGRPPVHPDVRKDKKLFAKEWKGAEGLAEDVRRYGQWMRDEAEKRIGHLYPKVEITAEMAKERPDLKPLVGQTLTVIAWIWARTVKSPNPAFSDVDVPLASTFILGSKPGKEAYIQPVIEKAGYRLTVKVGHPPTDAKSGTKAARANFRCLLSGVPISGDYVKEQGTAQRIGTRLLAIVAAGPQGRIYLPPLDDHEAVARSAIPRWRPETPVVGSTQYVGVKPYGMSRFDQLFTERQLTALSSLADVLGETREVIAADVASANGVRRGVNSIGDGDANAEYARALLTYLAMCVSRQANRSATLNIWDQKGENVQQVFGMQAYRMTWDFVEGNPFSDSTGNFVGQCDYLARVLENACPSRPDGNVCQADAQSQDFSRGNFISTDPPYYDNVPYADLSDFFYVWLRRSLKEIYPGLFGTMAVPKSEELVAFAYRHDGHKDLAEEFFLEGMTRAMQQLITHSHPAAPATIYYAFRQSDTVSDEGTASTGWETFLQAVVGAGYAISGTWPMRTEYTGNLKTNRNALASSIVLVCRPRAMNAGTVSRRQFVRHLNESLPLALDAMTRADESEHSPVAPVDLSQAIIGPGMAIFSRYDAVLEADGTPMTVKTALQLINRFLAEDDFDADTQFCLHWFDQHGWETGKFGEADTLARAKGTSVDGVKQAGVLEAGGGNVRLLRWRDYAADWNAKLDTRLPVWEALHHMIRAYSSRGDAGSAKVLKAVGSQAEAARQLGYRLYTLCERKGWAEDARAYNELVTGWSGIERAAGDSSGDQQRELFDS